MRKYLLPILLLVAICLVWKGFDLYLNEQRRTHESIEREKDRQELEKDRDLQREIMKAEKEQSKPK